MDLPKISIIVPSFNQGMFIEETIKSVLDQNYPALEFFIIDGGSNDQTVSVIKKYSSHITYWISEKDNGQTHAINKGLVKATGDILAYINSDDYYLPGTFHKIAEAYLTSPDADIIHGICRYVNERGEKIGQQKGSITKYEEIVDLWGVWWKKRNFVQPEVFWTRKAFNNVGLLNEELYFVMDYEYWLRILKTRGLVVALDSEVSCFRRTEMQKSIHSKKVAEELLEVVYPYYKEEGAIDEAKRKRLLGNHSFQKYFLTKIEESIDLGDTTFVRWLKLARVIVGHPEIRNSQFLRDKIGASLKGFV